jgi:hypothetical protein
MRHRLPDLSVWRRRCVGQRLPLVAGISRPDPDHSEHWNLGSEPRQLSSLNFFYHTIDGATFTATDTTDLMRKLRADSFNPGADLRSYCTATAQASKMQTGKAHRAWPPEALVADMLASGLVATGTHIIRRSPHNL